MKRVPVLGLLCLLALMAEAGEFKSYNWRFGFLMGEGYYQPTVTIEYDYRNTDGQFNPEVLGLPNLDNLHVQKMNMKVDGKRVEPIEMDMVTWWSHGKSTRVFLPPKEGERIRVKCIFVIKNLFLIPPAPTSLPVPIKSLEVGFAPIPGFIVSGSFIGEEFAFSRKKIAARPGEAKVLHRFRRKDVPASKEQGLLFLMAKSFTFSFNAMRAGARQSTTDVGGPDVGFDNSGVEATMPGDADSVAAASSFSISGDLKPYSASFYKGIPMRDWRFSLTWLQQERIYLPFGVQPGGRVKSRSLFQGAGDREDDLIPWIDPVKKKFEGDAVVEVELSEEPDVVEVVDTVDTVQSYIDAFRETMKVNSKLSRLVAYEDKSGAWSPALANRALANQLSLRYKLKAVPALISVFPKERIGGMPLSAFDATITAVQVGRNWFFVDASNNAWGLNRSNLFMRGHSVVILDVDNIQLGGF